MNTNLFSKREIQLTLHKALAVINTIVAIYCAFAGMHFTFNTYAGMSTNVVAIICYIATAYATCTAIRYDKSIKYLERKTKNESEI